MCQVSVMSMARRVAGIEEMRSVCKPGWLIVPAILGRLRPGSADAERFGLMESYKGLPPAC